MTFDVGDRVRKKTPKNVGSLVVTVVAVEPGRVQVWHPNCVTQWWTFEETEFVRKASRS